MLNKVAIQGRLTKDPELRMTQSGVSVCTFTVASDGRKDASGNTATLFMDCTAWRGLAETVSRYCGKGDMVIVEGSLVERKWTDRDGNARRSVELSADEVHFCGSRRGRSDGAGQGGYDDGQDTPV